MNEPIPHCNELFLRFFAPRYADWQVNWHELRRARADLTTYADFKGLPVTDMSPLPDDVIEQLTGFLNGTLINAATDNIGHQLGLEPPVDMDWIAQIDQYYDVGRIAELIATSDPEDDENPYFLRAIEIGAIIAANLRGLVTELEWYPDPPYWEAGLWHSATAQLIPPTHWAIKKLSSYGHDDGLADKIYAAAGSLKSATRTT